MNTIRIGFVIAVVCVLTFVTTTVFAQDTSARERDRAEIEELMWRYTRALDTGDGTTYAATYIIDQDHANHHAYYITVTGAGPDNAPPRIVAAGRSVDHLVRVNGKWLIQLRDVSPKE